MGESILAQHPIQFSISKSKRLGCGEDYAFLLSKSSFIGSINGVWYIRKFGGDPSNCCLFGHSASGSSSVTHTAYSERLIDVKCKS